MTATDASLDPSQTSRVLLVTPPQAAAMLAISRTTLYYLARDGDLTAIRIGRTTRFAITDLESYVQRRLAQSAYSAKRQSGAH